MKYYFLVAVILILTSAAQAQLACDFRNEMVSELNSKYDESQTGFGISLTGKQMLELFTSNSGTWTILLTHANGKSCAMAAGNSWTHNDLDQQRRPQ